MSAWNSEKFLAATLDSVAAQTYRPIEVVLVDDGSTDRTVEIAEAYERADPEMFRVVSGGERLGPCRQRNRAIDAARGSLLCWLDADDLWLPTKVAEQVDVMRARPDVGLVFTAFEAFDDETGRILHTTGPAPEDDRNFLRQLFMEGCFVGASTAMLRRSVFEGPGPYLRESEFSYGDDYYLWMMIAVKRDVVFLPGMLARYRRHDDNLSARTARSSNASARLAGLQLEFLTDHPEAKRLLGRARRHGPALWYASAAISECAPGRRPFAGLRYALRALSLAPVATTVSVARTARNAVLARRVRMQ